MKSQEGIKTALNIWQSPPSFKPCCFNAVQALEANIDIIINQKWSNVIFQTFCLNKFRSQNLNTTWKRHWLQCQSLKKSSSKRTHRAWTNLPFVWSQELTAHWLQEQDLFPRCRRSEIPFCMLLLTEGWHLRMSIWLLDVGSIFWDAKGNKVCSG